MRAVPEVDETERRLRLIFEALDSTLSNSLAARAAVALIYMDVVVADDADLATVTRLAAPRQCLWLSQQVLDHRTADGDREAWFQASGAGSRAKDKVRALEQSWGLVFTQWAGDNSREPLRDETFHYWEGHEAIRLRADVPTTSPRGRWALAASFADLLDPELIDLQLDHAIDQWQRAHLSENIKWRVDARKRRERASAGISVRLPGIGTQRSLEAGPSSEIVRAVLEDWAPRRLRDPDVLALSQPGDKVPDRSRLARLGVTLDEGNLLPDVLLVDIDGDDGLPHFWIVEIVATSGPINERRKQQLLQWAEDQHLPVERCHFLTAFDSRSGDAVRRFLKELAVGTYVFFADEPDRELFWYELAT